MGILEHIEKNKQESVYTPLNKKNLIGIISDLWVKAIITSPVDMLITMGNWDYHISKFFIQYPEYKIKRKYHKRIDIMEHRFYKGYELQFRKYINRYGEEYRTKNMLDY